MSTSKFMQLAHARRGGYTNLCPDPRAATTAGLFWPSRVFDVMDYGATHDGTTDDCSAIQNAINAAAATGGGFVYLEAGTYNLNLGHSFHSGNGCCLELRNGVYLRGDGPGSTILKCTNVIGAGHIGGSDVVNSGVSDLEMYFAPVTTWDDPIKLFRCSDFVMDNVVMHDGAASGTNFMGCINVLVKDCVAYNFASVGFASTNAANLSDGTLYGENNFFVDCEAYACQIGFRIYGKSDYDSYPYPSRQKNPQMTNCYSHDNVFNALFATCEDVVVEECTFEDSSSATVYIACVDGGRFHHNTYIGTGGTGIHICVNSGADAASWEHYAIDGDGDSYDIVVD